MRILVQPSWIVVKIKWMSSMPGTWQIMVAELWGVWNPADSHDPTPPPRPHGEKQTLWSSSHRENESRVRSYNSEDLNQGLILRSLNTQARDSLDIAQGYFQSLYDAFGYLWVKRQAICG